LRILFTYEYPFHRIGYGGGQQITRGLAKQLARMGHDIHVCCPGTDEMQIAESDALATYHFSGNYSKRWSGLETAWRSARLIGQLRPDNVCCFTSESVWIVPFCNLLKIPTAVYLAAPDLPSFRLRNWAALKRIRFMWPVFLMRLATSVAKKVTTISDFSSRQANTNWGVPWEKLDSVGVGLDDVFIKPIETSKLTSSTGGIRFISIGRFALKQKPLDVMAESLAKLPISWQRWTLVGSGPDEQKFRAKLIELGILDRVVFAGTLNSTQIAALLLENDVVLLPTNYESFFITAYEAAAMGRIVVTNDVADIKKYFGNTSSVIIADSVSCEDFTQAVTHAISRGISLQRIAEATAMRVKVEINWETVAVRFLQVLESRSDK
jgi:glycosyltransferase involved in cell wall biosynthesis